MILTYMWEEIITYFSRSRVFEFSQPTGKYPIGEKQGEKVSGSPSGGEFPLLSWGQYPIVS
jgi:hypothetical protein